MPYRGTRPWSRVRRPGLALSGSSARAKPLLVGGNGGRAGGAWPGVEAVAETVVFGEMSTGASNDLERATALARRMITEYGMGERLGVVTFGSNEERVMFGGESRSYSEQTAHAIDAEVHRLLDQATHARMISSSTLGQCSTDWRRRFSAGRHCRAPNWSALSVATLRRSNHFRCLRVDCSAKVRSDRSVDRIGGPSVGFEACVGLKDGSIGHLGRFCHRNVRPDRRDRGTARHHVGTWCDGSEPEPQRA